MSSRRNFLDADNSIMERNLRFVKNDLEENFNQYFGASTSQDNNFSNLSAPPRDYKVIQPKPGGSHAQMYSIGLEERRGFLLRIGLPRHEAYELAKNTNFDANILEQKYNDYFSRGFRQDDVNSRILCDIRNWENWEERDAHPEHKTSPPPSNSTFCEKDNLNITNRKCKDFQNRSRLRSPSYEPSNNNRREGRYQREVSISSDRDFGTIHKIKGDEYFSSELTARNDLERETSREQYHFLPYSPSKINRREEHERSPRSRSPIMESRLRQWQGDQEYFIEHNFRDEIRVNRTRTRSRSYSPTSIRRSRSRSRNRGFDGGTVDRPTDEEVYRPYTPPRSICRDENFHSSRSRSPSRTVSDRATHRHIYDTSLEVRRNVDREQSPPRSYSPLRHVSRDEYFQPSPLVSALKRFSYAQGRECDRYPLQHENYRDIERSNRCRSRSYTPSNFRRQEYHHSSRSPSIQRRIENCSSQNKYFEGEIRRELNYCSSSAAVERTSTATTLPPRKFSNTGNVSNNSEFLFTQQDHSRQNQNIPSLLAIDLFPNQTQSSEVNSQNRNIPSLFSLEIFPNRNDFQTPSTSKRVNSCDKKLCTTKAQRIEGNKKINHKNGPVLRQHIAEIPVIPSGLAKPKPGHLKANPRDYWSQWWPQYKYIEISIPKINSNDSEVKSCINFLLRPNSNEFRKRCHLLLNKAVKQILKTVNINERNYYVRDIYKLFQYKKHLEDPNFQNHLTSKQLNSLAPALRQFQIRSTLAFLHQALIVKWHISLDIMKKVQAGEPLLSNYARILLNTKSFHYLVMESIQELKKMCQQDWPQFNAYYESIPAKKVDIYSLGLNSN